MPPGLQEFFETLSAWALLLWIGFGLGVLGLVCRWFSKNWKNLKRLFALVDALIGLPEFMERIRHQVENDHDTNLRDEVTQILDLANDTASKVAELADRQERHERKSVATLRRLGAIEDHIKENT